MREEAGESSICRGAVSAWVSGAGGEEEHVVLLVMHHIICDGWSLGVWSERWGNVGAYSRGSIHRFRSWRCSMWTAVWQREWLGSG